MNPESYIEGASLLVDKTPIHPIPDAVVKISDDLKLLAEKCRQPLKIVLMGASNSGKSTLLNALAGEKVSPVDICETTAVIIRIKYASEQLAKIHFYERECLEGQVDKIFHVLENHRNDIEFASSCREVEIALPLPALRNLELVDTPGLGTITQKNQETTRNYINQADVVLWTLHSAYINNQTIENEIDDVFDLGKPIICVATHVDEVHASANQVADAIEDAFPGYFENVFPVDASKAYTAVCDGILENMEKTGFQALLDELKNVYDSNSEEVQSESLLDSTQSLIIKDKDLHMEEIRRWQNRRKAYFEIEEDLRHRCRNIEEKFVNDLDYWLETDFFNEEKTQLMNKIGEIKFTSKKDNEDELKQLWEAYFSEKHIQSIISSYVKNNVVKLESDWYDEIKDLQESVKFEYGDLILNKESRFVPNSDNLTFNAEIEDSINTIGKTTAASVLFGGAASAYAAGLGTYAAHLSMAGALGSFMPPVLVAGVLVGLIKRYADIKSLQKKWGENVENALDDLRRKIRNSLSSGYRGTIQSCNRAYCAAIKENFLKDAFGLNTIHDVSRRIEAIEEHRNALECYMDEAPSYRDIIEYLHQRMEGLIKANNELKESASDGNIINVLKQMKIKLNEMSKAKLHLEQELDKKERKLQDNKKELEEQRLANLSSKDIVKKLSTKLERNKKEKDRLEIARKKLEGDYEKAKQNVRTLEAEYDKIKNTLSEMQAKMAKFKKLGIDLDADGAFDKLEASMQDVTASLIENDKMSYQEHFDKFKCQFPLYDNDTINDLTTGCILRQQFLPFKDELGMDFSPALLPALVMMERIMRDYYKKRGFVKNPSKCPWAVICNDVKKHEFNWRPGFGDELIELKSIRNQAVHVGNIDYCTYEKSYGRIVADSDSVINFIYFVVTK